MNENSRLRAKRKNRKVDFRVKGQTLERWKEKDTEVLTQSKAGGERQHRGDPLRWSEERGEQGADKETAEGSIWIVILGAELSRYERLAQSCAGGLGDTQKRLHLVTSKFTKKPSQQGQHTSQHLK